MLKEQISGFIAYCKVSGFKNKSIATLSLKLNQFNGFINQSRIQDIGSIQYCHLRQFVADYGQPSIHVKKARIWALRQFFHYLTLTEQRGKNIATDLAYPKIEKTVPQFLTPAEYESLLAHCALAANSQMGLRNLIVIMLLGTLGLRTNAVIALNIQDVDTVAGLLRVREKGESGESGGERGRILIIHYSPKTPMCYEKSLCIVSIRSDRSIPWPCLLRAASKSSQSSQHMGGYPIQRLFQAASIHLV